MCQPDSRIQRRDEVRVAPLRISRIAMDTLFQNVSSMRSAATSQAVADDCQERMRTSC